MGRERIGSEKGDASQRSIKPNQLTTCQRLHLSDDVGLMVK